jgi:hypothetical protein
MLILRQVQSKWKVNINEGVMKGAGGWEGNKQIIYIIPEVKAYKSMGVLPMAPSDKIIFRH